MLGEYGKKFGAPQFSVTIKDDKIQDITVERGAPCGATWEAVKSLIGKPATDAPIELGLKTQMFCVADPAGWDPINGKSPVHLAGELHCAALKSAMKQQGD